ncbi:MAG: HAMP domain-containing sensor histidine kinase, partial [Ignavibacteriaceae bacterium]
FKELCEIIETGKALNRESVLYDPLVSNTIKCALDLKIVKLGDGLAISCREITETKTVLEKLKEINKNKDKLFSIIAHDLKAPFHSFLGISETLARNSGSLTPEETQKFFQASSKTVKTTFKLLEDLLEWANSQSDHVMFNPVPFSLSDLLAETILLYNNIAKEKGVRLIFNNILDYDVFGDRNMIDTVFRNLLSNAVKYTSNGGEVLVNILPNETHCKVLISDTGTGITQNNLNKIFTLGEKVTSTGTDNEKGSGLGLILCKDFIERNSGQLSVESIPGKGSTFSFTIPFPSAAAI